MAGCAPAPEHPFSAGTRLTPMSNLTSNPVSDFPILDGKRILLIISGGIAAYKMPRADPAPARARGCGALHSDRRWRAVRHAAVGRALRRRRSTRTCSRSPTKPRWAISGCRARRPCRRRAGHRRHSGEDGGRARRRPAVHRAARDRQAGHGGAGDEREDVGARRDPREHGDAGGRGVARIGPGAGDMACGEIGMRPHGRADGDPGRHRDGVLARRGAGPLRRLARAGHQRPDARADRSRALYRQPLVGQAGPRHRRGAGRDSAPRSRLVSGPRASPTPPACAWSHVETARDMLAACRGRAAGRRRGLRRRGRRLAGRGPGRRRS